MYPEPAANGVSDVMEESLTALLLLPPTTHRRHIEDTTLGRKHGGRKEDKLR